ncbi:MAG: hypothetical protein Q8O95_06350 [bacterium]|nr:hypothetical protein [bacterium]
MLSDFSSEMSVWRQVFALRRATIGFFLLLMFLVVSVFLLLVWEYHLLEYEVSQLTTQTEIIAELDRALLPEQQEMIRSDIEQLVMVQSVELWSSERSAQYIDQRILSGYMGFLQKNQLDIPVNPLLRIQLIELSQKDALERILQDRFGQQLSMTESHLGQGRASFATEFIGALTRSLDAFQVLVVLIFLVLIFGGGYLSSYVLSERSRGFHLTQVLHLSPPYLFWPAFLVSALVSLALVLVSVLVVGLYLQQILWGLGLSLLGVLLMKDLILVWLGRFVIVKWGMR